MGKRSEFAGDISALLDAAEAAIATLSKCQSVSRFEFEGRAFRAVRISREVQVQSADGRTLITERREIAAPQ